MARRLSRGVALIALARMRRIARAARAIVIRCDAAIVIYFLPVRSLLFRVLETELFLY